MKSGSHFYFKNFSVAHDRSTHKVGTDGVLLGAWVDIKDADRILDVGTGTGVISLMLAQRTDDSVKIDAIEIEKDDAAQAEENVKQSPWPNKINIHHTSIQNFFPQQKFDLIISNPPYFIKSWLPPGKKRSQARHTHQLTFEELLNHSKILLNPTGRLAVILPYREGLQFIELAKLYALWVIRKWAFRSRTNKPIERWLLEFSQAEVFVQKGELTLYNQDNKWSEEYIDLTREFYLNL